MLVARRDPPLHAEAHVSAPPLLGVHPDLRPPRLLRFVTMMQLLGSVLAVPIGLASAYSIYRANFSPETTCQNLRTNIVSMLDKNVDAGARHILVRRDVEAFEQNCGAVDPDATAAFKALLAADAAPKAPAMAAAPATPAAPKVERNAAPVKDAERKAEPRPQQVVKHTPAIKTPIASDWVHREPAVSDAQWLDAVRQAMASHREETPPVEAAKPRALAIEPRPAQEASVQPLPAPAVVVPAPVAAPIALTPAAAVETPQHHADHPVPPSAIPDPAEVAAANANDHRSRVRRWIAKIPLMGNVIDNGLE